MLALQRRERLAERGAVRGRGAQAEHGAVVVRGGGDRPGAREL
jgi:hypothetical protein